MHLEIGELDIPSLTLTLEQSQDVLLPNRSLDVTDDGSVWVIHELYTDLSNTSTRTSPSKDLGKYKAGQNKDTLVISLVIDLGDGSEFDGGF